MKHANVLIITPDRSGALSRCLRDILSGEPGISLWIEQTGDRERDAGLNTDCFAKTRIEQIDIVLIVTSRPQILRYGSIVSCIKSRKSSMPIIIVDDTVAPEEIMEYFAIDVSDYIAAPLRAVDILPRIWRLIEYGRESVTFTHKIKSKIGLRRLVGESPAFLAVIGKIPAVAQSDVGVLISGETGTGKEMCARSIHYLGSRAGKPFLPVNCGAIPVELIENELFGHVRGAFTGAFTATEGLISESNGGTLFLDEIDCLPLQAQAKLLRFLQEKEYRQVGSSKVRKADVRVLAATNIDLVQAVTEGRFRRDLFYRLSIVHLALPPLRERAEDIPLLARHFLLETTADLGRNISDFALEAMRKLATHDWPGNVRELENIVQRAVIFAREGMIQRDDIDLPFAPSPAQSESFQTEKARVVAEFENRYIRELLHTCHGNITKAAQSAGKNRRAFWELIRKHKIDVRKFKPCPTETRMPTVQP